MDKTNPIAFMKTVTGCNHPTRLPARVVIGGKAPIEEKIKPVTNPEHGFGVPFVEKRVKP